MEIFISAFVAMLLVIATIMAVVISINNHTKWGVTIKDWREMDRRKLTFSVYLFCTIIISLFLFILMAIYLTNLRICKDIISVRYLILYWVIVSLLSIVVIIITILYLCTELPLLLSKDKTFEKIYRNRFQYQDKIKSKSIINGKKNINNTSENEDKFSKTLNKLTEYLVFSKGIGKTLEMQMGLIKDKSFKAKCLQRLFETQNSILWNLSKKSKELIILDTIGENDLKLSTIYDYTFENIKFVLSFKENSNVPELLGNDTYYYVTRSLFFLSEFDNNLFKDIQSKFKDVFTQCLYTVILDPINDSENIKFANKIFLTCFAYALNDNKYKLFLNSIIDTINENLWVLSSDNENARLIFLLMSYYIYYLDKISSNSSNETKELIGYFFKEVVGNNLIYINWQQSIKKIIPNYMGSKTSIIEIKKLLEYVDFFSNFIFISSVRNIDTIFNEVNVIDWYLETYAVALYNEDFINKIAGNDIELKRKISNTIYQRWLGHNENRTSGKEDIQGHDYIWLKENMPLREYFGLSDVTKFKNQIIDNLSKFHNSFNVEEAMSAVEKIKPETDESIADKTKKLYNSLLRININDNDYPNFGYDEKINLSKIGWKMIESLVITPLERVGVSYYGNMFDLTVESFKDAIIYNIREQVKQKSTNTKQLNEVTDWVKKNKAKFSSGEHRWYHETAILDLEIINSFLLCPCTILCDNAIKFKVEINEDKTKVINLTNEQISKIIQRDYTREDGRYVYNYSGVQIYLNREELYNIIKTTHYIVQAVFRYKVVVNNRKIINFKE